MNHYKRHTMNATLSTMRAFGSFIKNKAIAIIVLAVSAYIYLGIPADSATPMPFVEVFYAGILLGTIIVVAPFIRLLVFPEVASYAESGELRKDLATRSTISPALLHYWFATAICYAATILCVTALLNLK